MKKNGNAPIKEIAEKLGVSLSTVSVVLNGRGDAMRISKATQKRVREAAKELNYHPNIYARRLRTSGAEEAYKVIAVFWCTDFTDDMLGRFFRGAQRCVKDKDYKVEFYVNLFDSDHLSDWKDIMTSSHFSGIIISGISDGKDMEFLDEHQFDLPVVLLYWNVQKYNCVYLNDYEIGKNSAKLFSLRKHKRVGLVSLKKRLHGAVLRQMGFLETCAQCGLEIKKEWIQEAEGRDCNSGYESMKKILAGKERPTAIFVMAPEQVLGVIMACRDEGIEIPKDMEVLTYGDNSVFPYFSPSISSVHIPLESVGENALSLLTVVIDGQIDIPVSRMLSAEFAFRESCGGYPKDS